MKFSGLRMHKSTTSKCPAEFAVRVLGRKWTTTILTNVADQPGRYGDLRRAIDGISDKVLTERLRELEQRGLITRRMDSTSRLGGVYALTAHGRTLVAFIPPLKHWGEQYAALR